MALKLSTPSLRTLSAALTVSGIIIAPAALAASSDNGFIEGTVLNLNGKAAAGVSVTVANEDSIHSRQVGNLPQPMGKTDQEGRFRIGPIESGSYSVFVFGSKDYPDYHARPKNGVLVTGGVSKEVTLCYEQSVKIEVAMEKPTRSFGLQGKYWVRAPHRPLVAGLPTYYGMPGLKKSSIKLTTLPGVIELSMDPFFSDGAEIFKFHVESDGKIAGPKAIPPPELAPVRFVLSRTDGESLERFRIRLHLAGWAASSIGESVSNFVVQMDRKDSRTAYVTRGVVARAFVSAEGCEFAESMPFAVLPGMEPVEINLEPAEMAEVTICPTGIPSDLDDKVSLNSYQWRYRSRSSGLVSWLPLKSPEGNPSKSLSLSGLPEGSESYVRFRLAGERPFEGSLGFQAKNGMRLAFPIEAVDPPYKQNETESGSGE